MEALLTFLLLLVSCTCSVAQWILANHGKPPIYTGMAYMNSWGKPKLFAVGNRKLQERYWSGSAWVWANHGSPWLPSSEWLASRPCVMRDGRVYVITNRGRMFERYWTGTAWAWGHHGKANGNIPIRHTTCTCTYRGNIARVFVVGTNFKLYERYWSWSSSAWVWRYHGTPPGVSSLAPTHIDSCNALSCDTLVYVVGNGRLYALHITTANPGVATWQPRGHPGKAVRSVKVGIVGGYVFVSTYDNEICQYNSPNNFYCFGKPPGSTNQHSVAMSKSILVNNCPNLTSGSARYVFMHGWDPNFQKRSRLWSLKVTGVNIDSWKLIDNVGSQHRYYIDAPEVWMSGTCPKLFSVHSGGYVDEHSIQ